MEELNKKDCLNCQHNDVTEIYLLSFQYLWWFSYAGVLVHPAEGVLLQGRRKKNYLRFTFVTRKSKVRPKTLVLGFVDNLTLFGERFHTRDSYKQTSN